MCGGVSRNEEEKFLKAGGLIIDKRPIGQDLRFVRKRMLKTGVKQRCVCKLEGSFQLPGTAGHRQHQARSNWDWVRPEARPHCRDRMTGSMALGGCGVSQHFLVASLRSPPTVTVSRHAQRPGPQLDSHRSGPRREPCEL